VEERRTWQAAPGTRVGAAILGDRRVVFSEPGQKVWMVGQRTYPAFPGNKSRYYHVIAIILY
jgi:hypothetical protein